MFNGFAEFLYYLNLYKTWFVTQVNWWPEVAGAAAGAFLAFLLTLLYNYLREYRARWIKHMNILVQLQFILNENSTYVDDNISSLKQVKNMDMAGEGVRVVGWITFREFRNAENILDQIRDNRLLNDLFSYNMDVSKINHDLLLIQKFTDEIRQAQFARQITIENAKLLLAPVAKMTDPLIRWNQSIFEKTKAILIRTRIILEKEKRRPIRYLGKRLKLYPITKDDIERMGKTLDSEMSDVLEKNRNEVAKRMGEANVDSK